MTKSFDYDEREVIVSEKYALKSNAIVPDVVIHEKFMPDFRARLAVQLVERWGLVASDISKEENSAGRNKVRLLNPDEIVARACDTSDLLVTELHKRGWMTPLPSYTQAVEMLDKVVEQD